MSTNSMIGIQLKENEFAPGSRSGIYCVYCHWDGYPQHTGRILLESYQDKAKIIELISGGDLSALGSKINPDETRPHTFDNPQEDVCIYYNRDRGEEWSSCSTTKGLLDIEFKDWAEHYNYLYDDGQWYISRGKGEWEVLTVEMVSE